MTSFPVPPPLGVGQRRKGPTNLPKLPLSAFASPNTAGSESFPTAPSPSTIHPAKVVDAHVAVPPSDDLGLNEWMKQAGQSFGNKMGGVVAILPDAEEKSISKFEKATLKESVLSLGLPLKLVGPTPSSVPTATVPTSFFATYTASSPEAIATLKWALEQKLPVDVDVQTPLSSTEAFEQFEDFLTKATDLPEGTAMPPIVLSNLLPPPDDLELPLVKLINHPGYQSFQGQIASLSLFPTAHIKLLPPAWNTALAADGESGSSASKELKKRIKMYIGPVIEAFGTRRILFGSSSASTDEFGGAGAWYDMAREAMAELAIEQEDIDAVFAETARKVYASSA